MLIENLKEITKTLSSVLSLLKNYIILPTFLLC